MPRSNSQNSRSTSRPCKTYAIFGATPLDLNNAEDRKKIAESIDADLSPENLSCDGELNGPQIVKKLKHLQRAAIQLLDMDDTVTIYELGIFGIPINDILEFITVSKAFVRFSCIVIVAIVSFRDGDGT